MNAVAKHSVETFHDSNYLAPEALDVCRMTGYELYKARNYPQAEVVCRGLVAADNQNWYHHSLLAATLQKMGRYSEAVAQIEEGLRCLPGQPRLLSLRTAIAYSALRAASRLGLRDEAVAR